MHRLVRGLTGDGDPYADLKQGSNNAALSALPRLRKLVDAAANRLARVLERSLVNRCTAT
ncbi:MAG TPA: ARMT1-like domain-containing protein [Thermoleophilia bacterium]|nr:ARMT1-like domain-containing protein [Thermoleophilia bacterium]